MTLSVVRQVAVLDRSGRLRYTAHRLGLDVSVVTRPADLDGDLPPVDVLLVGSRELTATGLRRVERWRRSQPVTVVVAHLDGRPVDRAALRAAGVQHVIRGRLTSAKLEAALARADATLCDLLDAAERLAYDVPSQRESDYLDDVEDLDDVADVEDLEEVPDDDADEAADAVADADDPYPSEPATPLGLTRRARLVTIASATGGCGKTFFATNAAALLARAGRRVLLVDLDLQFGEVAAALRVDHPYSLYDGLYGNGGERLPPGSLAQHLDVLVHHHPLGFDVLTAPRDPVLADYVGARDAAAIIEAVADRYEVVLADTPPSLNDVVIAALDRSDRVLVLATLDVPSLRNLTAFLDVLNRLGLDGQRIELVLNKADKDVGVTVDQALEAFDGRFKTVLPLDRAVSRAVNLGTTVATLEPKAKVSRALVPGVARVAAELGFTLDEAPVPEGRHRAVRRPSLAGRLWRRLRFGGAA